MRIQCVSALDTASTVYETGLGGLGLLARVASSRRHLLWLASSSGCRASKARAVHLSCCTVLLKREFSDGSAGLAARLNAGVKCAPRVRCDSVWVLGDLRVACLAQYALDSLREHFSVCILLVSADNTPSSHASSRAIRSRRLTLLSKIICTSIVQTPDSCRT